MAEPFTSEMDIVRLEESMHAICEGLPIESGAIVRLAHQYYERYRIRVNDTNRPYLRSESRRNSEGEWEGGDSQSNDAIGRAIDGIGLGQGDRELNKGVAQLLVAVLLAMDDGKRRFNIADLGAGTGNTTDAILEVMRKDERTIALAGRCTFSLVDLSWDRLDEARETIWRNRINDALEKRKIKLRCNPRCEALEGYLEGEGAGRLDVIVSSAALHHCSFPDHFAEMHRVLGEDGVLVIGDWHNNLFSHPANLIALLRRLGASTDQIRDFKLLFNVTENDAKNFTRGLTEGEMIANTHFANFIVAMANELRGIEQRSRLCFFEALESVQDRVEKINGGGFVTDIEELRAKHKGFLEVMDPRKGNLVRPVFPKTTVACVMGAAKIG